MSVIDRNVTRTVLDGDEETRKTRTPATDALSFALSSVGNFRMAFKSPFTTRHFNLSVPNTAATTVTIKIYDGTSFVLAKDIVDQTDGFTKSGFISWININDWRLAELDPIPDRELFWVELTVSVDLDAGTELQSVLNLFSDESQLRALYPEIATDTRYLPPGRTDFVEQLKAGTDQVILRLKQDKLIKDESIILDINEVALAATHATAWVILNPISRDDADKESAKKAFDDMNSSLNDVRLTMDFNESGVIDEEEEHIGDVFLVRG